MANNYTLSKLAENHIPISYYIITNDINEINSLDNYGDIAIYYSDEFDNSLLSYSSTHLYVGDEHIAGGYGFSSAEELAYAYNCSFNRIPMIDEKIIDIEAIINEKYSAEDDALNDLRNLRIDTKYKYVRTEECDYRLNYDSAGTLSIVSEIREKLYNPEFYVSYDNNTKFKQLIAPPNIQGLPLGLEQSFFENSYVQFLYDGDVVEPDIDITKYGVIDESIKGFYFDATVRNDNETKTSKTVNIPIYASHADPIDSNTNNSYIRIIKKYLFEDPNSVPKKTQIQYTIYFKEDFIKLMFEDCELHNSESIVNLNINAVLKNNRKLTFTFLKIGFVPPMYYCAKKDMDDISNETDLVNLIQDLYDNEQYICAIGEYAEEHTLTFNNGLDAKYNFLFIPHQIIKLKMFDDGNLKPSFSIDKTGIEYKWYKYGDAVANQFILNHGPNSCNYTLYNSPNMYTGDTNWTIKF